MCLDARHKQQPKSLLRKATGCRECHIGGCTPLAVPMSAICPVLRSLVPRRGLEERVFTQYLFHNRSSM